MPVQLPSCSLEVELYFCCITPNVYLEVVEVDGAIHGDDSNLGAAFIIGYPVERFQNSRCCCSHHAALDCRVGHVNHKHVDQRLRRANHVLCGCNILHDRMVQLLAPPTVHRLLCLRIIVERRRHYQRLHRTRGLDRSRPNIDVYSENSSLEESMYPVPSLSV